MIKEEYMTTVEPIRKIKDIKKIEKLLETQNKRDLLLFTLGINCGLRISDILRLNVNDVKSKTYIFIKEQKTGKFKRIPINSKLKIIIKTYIKGKKENMPLFTNSRNNRLDRFSAYRIIKNACKSAGIKEKVGTHTLRKTFGYHHYKKFKDIAMLQKIFNHSSASVTLRYIGIEQDNIDESYIKLIL